MVGKDDRYAHLGETASEADTESTEDDTTPVDDDVVSVTIADGDTELEITTDIPGVSATDIESVVRQHLQQQTQDDPWGDRLRTISTYSPAVVCAGVGLAATVALYRKRSE